MRSFFVVIWLGLLTTMYGCASNNSAGYTWKQAGEACSTHDECPMGGYMCLGGICKTPWEDNYAHSQTDPASSPPAVTESGPSIEDKKSKELNELYMDLLAKARAGQTTYLKAARAHQEDFFRLYPEHSSNVYVKEYLSYMVLLGEKIDHKMITEAGAEYEMAKKHTELVERTEKSVQQQHLESQQVIVQQASTVAQQRQDRRTNALNLGLQILQWNHEQSIANQMGRQNCIWTRTHNGGYIQTCQ